MARLENAENETERPLSANAGTERRPVVEFAIENAQALKKRALRQTRVHEGAAAKPGRGGRPEAGSEAGAPASGSRQQQRKRRREEPEVLFTSVPGMAIFAPKTWKVGNFLRADWYGTHHVCHEQVRTLEDSAFLLYISAPAVCFHTHAGTLQVRNRRKREGAYIQRRKRAAPEAQEAGWGRPRWAAWAAQRPEQARKGGCRRPHRRCCRPCHRCRCEACQEVAPDKGPCRYMRPPSCLLPRRQQAHPSIIAVLCKVPTPQRGGHAAVPARLHEG